MIDILRTLKEHLYSDIKDIEEKGADSVMQEKFVFWSDKVRAEAKSEEKIALAEMMISDGKPIDEIERYTSFNAATLKQIAKSIGKTLML